MLIWLGLIKGYSKQLNAEAEIERRFWDVQWACRVQADYSNMQFKGPTTSPVSLLRSRPTVVTMKLPSFIYILHFFAHNWERKWGGLGKKPAKTGSAYMPEISPELRMQYLGGDYTNLVELHLDTVAAISAKEEKKSKRNILSRFIRRHTMRHMPQLLYEQNVKPIIDAQEARNYIILQFEERCHLHRAAHIGAYAGTGMLPFPQLLQISYKLFIRYLVDGVHYLPKTEWIQMAEDLKMLTERHEGNTLTVTEYSTWLVDFVNEINEYRAKDRRLHMKQRGPPPCVGPAPLSVAASNLGVADHIHNFDSGVGLGSATDDHSHHNLRLHGKHIIEPTHNVQEALERLYDRFQLLDPLDSQLLSAAEAYHLAQWIWTVYSPAGAELHSAELEEAEEELLLLIDKRSKILYPNHANSNELSESIGDIQSNTGAVSISNQKSHSPAYMRYSYSSPAGVLSLKDILKWFHVCDKRLRLRRSKDHSVAQSFRGEGYKLPKRKAPILKPGGTLFGRIKRAIVGSAVPKVDSGFAQLDETQLKLLPLSTSGSDVGTTGLKSMVIGGKFNKDGLYEVTNRTITQAPIPVRLPFPLSAVESLAMEFTGELASSPPVSNLNTPILADLKPARTRGISSSKLFPPEFRSNSAVMKIVPHSPTDRKTPRDLTAIDLTATYKVAPIITEPARGAGTMRSPQRLQPHLHVDLDAMSDADREDEDKDALHINLNLSSRPRSGNGTKSKDKSHDIFSKQANVNASASASDDDNSAASPNSSWNYFFDFDNKFGPDSDDENEANIRLRTEKQNVVFKIPATHLNKQGVRKLKDFASPRSNSSHYHHHHHTHGKHRDHNSACNVDSKNMCVKLDSDSDDEFFHKQRQHQKSPGASANVHIDMRSPALPRTLHAAKNVSTVGIEMTSPLTKAQRSADVLGVSMRMSPIVSTYSEREDRKQILQ